MSGAGGSAARPTLWRGYLTCKTCNNTVTVGPTDRDPSMAVYRMGRRGIAAIERHLGAGATIMSRTAPCCWRCGQDVTWLSLNGVPIAIEPCPPGRGDIGIQRQ